MATLAADWAARVPSQRQIELTNGATGGTTVDTTVRDNAISDVEGYFLVYINKAYDSSRAEHVALGVRGVSLVLLSYKMESTAEAKLEAWFEQLQNAALIDARDRLAPSSTSALTPADEQLGSETVRPWMDSELNSDMIPGRQGTRRDDNFPSRGRF